MHDKGQMLALGLLLNLVHFNLCNYI